jgi:macrodomain Ter protein organizer (MatP/YcbG family)
MPLEGYSSITIPEEFKNKLKKEADGLGLTLPEYIAQLYERKDQLEDVRKELSKLRDELRNSLCKKEEAQS